MNRDFTATSINIPRRRHRGDVVLIRWLQSALIPFVTTQCVRVLKPQHESIRNGVQTSHTFIPKKMAGRIKLLVEDLY